VAVGGGGLTTGSSNGYRMIASSYPSSNTVWTVTAYQANSTNNWTLQAYVICADDGS
jgi:hypothetical protein